MNRELAADPAQLDLLGGRFDAEAQTLTHLGYGIAGQLRHVEWFGPDAEQARYDWDTYYHGRIIGLAESLRAMAQQLRMHAEQQRIASGATDFGIHLPTFPNWPGGGVAPPWTVDSFFDGIAGGLSIVGLVGDVDKLVNLIPDGVAGLLRKAGFVGNAIGILNGLDEGFEKGEWGAVALGMVGMGLGAVALLPVAPWIIAAAAVTGIGLTVAQLFVPGFEQAVSQGIRSAGEGIVDFAYQSGQMIGEFTSAIAEPIGDGIEAVTSVAAPIVEGAKEFAGDVWEAGGQVLSGLNPFD